MQISDQALPNTAGACVLLMKLLNSITERFHPELARTLHMVLVGMRLLLLLLDAAPTLQPQFDYMQDYMAEGKVQS